ncbi:hypothetical protein ABIG06_006229 [Bradyrhizobium sp. USDA 326]|uniref:hypothetical protein n=1 Tax=Bradyrhizobium sp. USDA 326 TaxID=3377726 RepID=UPI003C778818
MSGDNVTKVAEAVQDEGDGRQRSSIGFPYNNLGDAVEVAQAIHDHVGTGDCDDSQLSAWMNVSPKSSGYRIQISAARMFCLVETTSGNHKLTPLGRAIVDPQQERAARANAFLSVPLYKAIFDKYKGGVLPPPAALERDIVGLGVAEKQTGRARQVFERSAEQANFFEHGKTRLVMPAVAVREVPPEILEDRNKNGGGGGGGDVGLTELGLDPLLIALLKKIPTSGEWPAAQRVRWFRTFAMNVSQIYDLDDEPVEMKIELDKAGN